MGSRRRSLTEAEQQAKLERKADVLVRIAIAGIARRTGLPLERDT